MPYQNRSCFVAWNLFEKAEQETQGKPVSGIRQNGFRLQVPYLSSVLIQFSDTDSILAALGDVPDTFISGASLEIKMPGTRSAS